MTQVPSSLPTPQRVKMPQTRQSMTSKNKVGDHEFYVTVGFYPDTLAQQHLPGEVFIKISKEGSTLAGMCDALALTISLALQHGVPWPILSAKYHHTRFEPSGEGMSIPSPTDNSTPAWKIYSSLADAIADTVDCIIAARENLWSS